MKSQIEVQGTILKLDSRVTFSKLYNLAELQLLHL